MKWLAQWIRREQKAASLHFWEGIFFLFPLISSQTSCTSMFYISEVDWKLIELTGSKCFHKCCPWVLMWGQVLLNYLLFPKEIADETKCSLSKFVDDIKSRGVAHIPDLCHHSRGPQLAGATDWQKPSETPQREIPSPVHGKDTPCTSTHSGAARWKAALQSRTWWFGHTANKTWDSNEY